MAKPNPNIRCPFCLKRHDFSKSLECPENPGSFIPEEFLEDEPLWLVTVGFSKHGKTVYLTALTLLLEEINAVWRGVQRKYLNEYTRVEVRKMRQQAIDGVQPPATDRVKPQPMLIRMRNLPMVGTRNLVIYDVAGELFNRPDELYDYVAALTYVETIWFFVSLKDMQSSDNLNRLDDLFDSYTSAMKRLGAPLDKRSMIVVYTKGDAVNFPPDLNDYLNDDPLRELTNRAAEQFPTPDDFNWDDYSAALQATSKRLSNYTRQRVRGGADFIHAAEVDGMRVEFALVSALGTSPHGTQMMEQATRFRVIDPFIWSLLLQNQGVSAPSDNEPRRSITLILDAAPNSGVVYDLELPSRLGDALSQHRIEVQTYYLGQSSVAAHLGQPPPERPPKAPRRPLVGAIFESLVGKPAPVIIVTHHIPLDLNDFRSPAWQARTLLVTFEPQELDDWEQFNYETESDFQPLVNMIKRLVDNKNGQ
jgi:hypothetical protein